MDKLKAFLQTAWTSIKDNATGVLEQFPYTVGFVYILGMLSTLLVQWLV